MLSLQLLNNGLSHIFVSLLNLSLGLKLLVDGSHKRIFVAFLHHFIVHVLGVIHVERVVLAAINNLLLLIGQAFIVRAHLILIAGHPHEDHIVIFLGKLVSTRYIKSVGLVGVGRIHTGPLSHIEAITFETFPSRP